jgi:hypothetical protein
VLLLFILFLVPFEPLELLVLFIYFEEEDAVTGLVAVNSAYVKEEIAAMTNSVETRWYFI